MKPLIIPKILLLLMFFFWVVVVSTGRTQSMDVSFFSAADLSEFGLTIVPSTPDGWVQCKDKQNNIFHIYSTTPITRDRLNRLLQLSDLFYAWQHVTIQKISFLHKKNQIRVVLMPLPTSYRGMSLAQLLPAGMAFTAQDNKLTYNFRLVNEKQFLTIQGTYVSETELLDKIVDVLKNPMGHIGRNTPEYFLHEIEALQNKVTNIKTENRLLKETLTRLKEQHEKDNLVLTREMNILGDEIKNIHDMFFNIHGPTLLGNSGIPWEETLISTVRYPFNMVQKVQILLSDAGYTPGQANGQWNYTTYKALVRFQEENKILIPTGSIDNLTQIVLFNRPLHTLDPKVENRFQVPPNLDFNPLQAGRFLRYLKMALSNQGFDPGNLGPDYDMELFRQILRFQYHQGIPTDGVLNEKTLTALLFRSLDDIQATVKMPPQPPVPIILLAKPVLFIKGYDPGDILSDQWGDGAIEATARFQQDHGVLLSGELDSTTLEMLFNGEVCNYIEKIQLSLERNGIPLKVVDGIWGRETEMAVKIFQERCGTPTTGRLDKNTINLLLLNETFTVLPEAPVLYPVFLPKNGCFPLHKWLKDIMETGEDLLIKP